MWEAFPGNAFAQKPVHGEFCAKDAQVRFWQTNLQSGGAGGVCLVAFGFDGELLAKPIDDLTLTIRAITRNGDDLGLTRFTLTEPLGGSRTARYREAEFGGALQWPDHDDVSPLCSEETTLLVESAVGS